MRIVPYQEDERRRYFQCLAPYTLNKALTFEDMPFYAKIIYDN